MKQHLAIYGNTQIVRADCWICGRYSFVVDGEIQCCGRPVDVDPAEIQRVSEPETRRRRPSAAHQREILQAQDYRCLYCNVTLDGYVTYHGELQQVRLTWDHMAPYAYTLNNHPENFAATCQFCNAWKSSLIFKTVDEVRIYVEAKWRAEGNQESRLREQGLQCPVSTEAKVAKVLQQAMPVPRVEQASSKTKNRERRIVSIKTWRAWY